MPSGRRLANRTARLSQVRTESGGSAKRIGGLVGFLEAATGCGLAANFAGGAAAQGLINVRILSAPLADELVGQAVANCAQKGYAVTAVVVDLDGVRQAMLRGDGAPIHTVDFAYKGLLGGNADIGAQG